MKWIELASLPTIVTVVPPGVAGVHESTLRAFNVLMKVVEYLRRGVPGPVILELLEELDTITVLVERMERAALLQPQGVPPNGSKAS